MSEGINNIDYKLQSQYLQDINQKDSESENLLSIIAFDSDNEEIEDRAYTVEDFETAFSQFLSKSYNELYDVNSDNMIEIITTLLYDIDINEQIDDSKQGRTADCWLLATLNSLSYSEKGQQIIDDAITKNNDGTYSVEFKGVNITVTISSEELAEAKESGQYSTGDDDVLLMELAFEKVMDMVKNGEIEDAPDWLVDAANNGKTSITGGYMSDAIYLLTGDSTKYQYNCKNADGFAAAIQSMLPWLATLFHNSMEYVYNLIEKNPDDYCATISFRCDDAAEGEAVVVQDIDGNDVILTHGGSGHAWSIKSIDGDYVTIVNP